jgi:hypothetical protein
LILRRVAAALAAGAVTAGLVTVAAGTALAGSPYYGELQSGGKCATGHGAGQAVTLAACTFAASQRWHSFPDGSIRNLGGLVLDNTGNSATARPQEWTWLGDKAQRWTIVGTTIKARYSAAVLPWHFANAASMSSCHTVTGPFTTRGGQAYDGSGRPFVPYGITLGELQDNYQWDNPAAATQDYTTYDSPDLADAENAMRAQMDATAAASGWCGNVVRIQFAQDDLIGPKAQAYLGVIRQMVAYAEKDGLVVVLNDQTETRAGHEGLPTAATETAWHLLDSAGLGRDPGVIDDLFNEPRIPGGNVRTDPAAWRIWRDGASIGGIRYIGMQQLASYVRHDGGRNLFWVEGLDWATTLNGVVASSANRLSGVGPLAYDAHYVTSDGTQWDAAFGSLAKRGIAPVVLGEWNTFTAWTPSCWPNAPTAVPALFRYLTGTGIGMTGWTLGAGALITSNNSYTTATRIRQDWNCAAQASDQGAGQLMMNWYQQSNDF